MGFSRFGGLAAASVVLFAAGAEAARAQVPETFQPCDGYGPPTARGDGVSFERNIAGLFSTYALYTSRGSINPGAFGVEACTTALADARLQSDYWMRRASLYRARALHQIGRGDLKAALADLDLAQAQAPDPAEPLYRRGMGAGIDLTRAYVLRLQGEQAAADALALKVFEDRPYSVPTAYAALYAAGPKASWDMLGPVLKRLGMLDPDFGAELSAFVTDGALHDAPELRAKLGKANDLNTLFALLPEAEAPGRVPRYGAITLLETEDGYVVHRHKKTDAVTVSMFGTHSSLAIVQEMALLKAAEVALERKKPALFVNGREAGRQSETQTMYGVPLTTNPNGYRTYVLVKYADEAAVAADDNPWRALDPEAIRAALAPIYNPPKKKPG